MYYIFYGFLGVAGFVGLLLLGWLIYEIWKFLNNFCKCREEQDIDYLNDISNEESHFMETESNYSNFYDDKAASESSGLCFDETFHQNEAMIQNLEAQEKIPNKNDDLDRDKCKLNRIVANTIMTTSSSSQRPLRLNQRSSRRQQRYSWHSSCEQQQQPQARKTERRFTQSARTSHARSFSADSTKKQISCDVSNLNSAANSKPNLQVIGTKNSIMQMGNPPNSSSRVSSPEQHSQLQHQNFQPVIKKSITSKLEPKLFKTKQGRTKEILQEIQRKINEESSFKKKSPYVVFRQKNIHDINNLVLELDNNLSFEGEKSQVSDPESTIWLGGLEIKNPNLLKLDPKTIIGSGTYALVYKSQLHGMDIAVKVFNGGSRENIPKEALTRKWRSEGQLMLQLRHPHIVQLVGACHHQGLPMLAFEYLDGGSLSHYIHEVIKSKLDHSSFFSIARDIILALNFLHNQINPIIHMDIKSANILLDAYLRAKIGDLGLAKVVTNNSDLAEDPIQSNHFQSIELSGPRGTPAWMAPEIFFEDPKVTTSTDIYGFGLIMWEMKTAEKPFGNMNLQKVCQAVSVGKRPIIPDDVSEDIKTLICQCWSQDHTNRPDCEEILQKLNNMSFPDHWKALLGPPSSNITPISEDTLEDLEPRTSVLFTRSFSAPVPIPPPPPPPPPPPEPAPAFVNKPSLTPTKNTISPAIPKPGFSVTSNELQNQINNLKKVDQFEESKNSTKHVQNDDLMNILKKHIDKRRESGFLNDFSGSSNASSGRSSAVNLCNKKHLSARSWSEDEMEF